MKKVDADITVKLKRRPRRAFKDFFRRLRKSFTLVELLIVVAIVAVVAVVVIIIISPAQLILQARDSVRLADIRNINAAVNLYTGDVVGGYVGSSSVVYVSIPDPAATTTSGTDCGGLGLPQLPPGYSYHCAATSTFRKVNGTGWIPVNFSQMSTQAPFSVLPVDPINTTTSGNYYEYTPAWVLWTTIGSPKYTQGPTAPTAPFNPSLYQTGPAAPTVGPQSQGLLGYWPFSEGSGVSTADQSGNGNTGTLVSSPLWVTSKTALGTALRFSAAAGNYVSFAPGAFTGNYGGLTLLAWLNASGSQPFGGARLVGNSPQWNFTIDEVGTDLQFDVNNWSNNVRASYLSYFNGWHCVAATFDGAWMDIYLDGSLAAHQASAYTTTGSGGTFYIGGGAPYGSLNGTLDEVHVYNRALSAAEIQAYCVSTL